MTIKLNGALGRCLAASALGALMAVAFAPTAMAQWMRPWGAPFPRDIEQSLEAQGYVLTAPLMRRPGVYLADVSAGPAGHQRLIIDARSGQVLERFPAPGRNWGPALAARDEEFGEPQPGGFGPPLGPGFAGQPAVDATAGSAYGGPANVHMPAAVSPYSVGETRAGTKAKLKSASRERKATINPPLPPPAPRESAKVDGSGSTGPEPTEPHDSGQPRIDSLSTNAGNEPRASATTTQGLSSEASDKPKVSIVPPPLFQ
jgi:hypothetical protein